MDANEPDQCSCDQCDRARRLVVFAREELELELQPWQEAVMLNLACCSHQAISSNWLESAFRAAKRRQSQLPPWARPVVPASRNLSRMTGRERP